MVPLTSNEQRILIRMKKLERTLPWVYISLGVAFLISISTIGIGVILDLEVIRATGYWASLLMLSLILGTRNEVRLFRIIKKLQQIPEVNLQNSNPSQVKD